MIEDFRTASARVNSSSSSFMISYLVLDIILEFGALWAVRGWVGSLSSYLNIHPSIDLRGWGQIQNFSVFQDTKLGVLKLIFILP